MSEGTGNDPSKEIISFTLIKFPYLGLWIKFVQVSTENNTYCMLHKTTRNIHAQLPSGTTSLIYGPRMRVNLSSGVRK